VRSGPYTDQRAVAERPSGSDPPLFSIILPTFARQHLLDEAVASVLAQSVQDFEVIVVDDASPTPVTVPADPRIRLIRRETNGGAAAARNTGMDVARGRYVCFIDDDDLFTRERLALALEGHERSPIALCWAPFLGDERRAGRRLNGCVRSTILDGTTPHLGATSVERVAAPRFDERFIAVEDVDWWVRAAEANGVATIEAPGYLVRRHDGSRHGADVSARIRGSRLLLDKHQEYFRHRPRAAAFRWRRIGQLAAAAGNAKLARAALVRSLWLRPSAPALAHLSRTLRARGVEIT
jgi:glycosyltransferase involved in cell wall biosynthesis